MCSEHYLPPNSEDAPPNRASDDPPDWENMSLPPEHILTHLTDAHCHPTDLEHHPDVYNAVQLGGLAAMATMVDDQVKVKLLSESRGWSTASLGPSKSSGPRVVACFGYHPWFVHRYTILEIPPSKEEHYTSIFFQSPSTSMMRTTQQQLLNILLPYLPDPIPFGKLLEDLRENIKNNVEEGRLTMLGEVGLDGGARIRWPIEARHLYTERHDNVQPREEGEWKRLTPFKTCITHQREILKLQIEVAIELGVNVSLHSVAAAGATYETLLSMRNKYPTRFTKINIDLHSGGGWSSDFWQAAEKNLSNLYLSPSIFITSRSTSAVPLIRSVSSKKLLVESDSHDVRLCTRLVWGAVEWIGRVRGWKIEGIDSAFQGGDWEMGGESEDEDEDLELVKYGKRVKGKSQTHEVQVVWTVRTLERNWARFMRIIED